MHAILLDPAVKRFPVIHRGRLALSPGTVDISPQIKLAHSSTTVGLCHQPIVVPHSTFLSTRSSLFRTLRGLYFSAHSTLSKGSHFLVWSNTSNRTWWGWLKVNIFRAKYGSNFCRPYSHTWFFYHSHLKMKKMLIAWHFFAIIYIITHVLVYYNNVRIIK